MSIEDFWNKICATTHQTRIPSEDNPVLSALRHFGVVSDTRLLEIGCGDESSSLFFAKKRANVVAIDISRNRNQQSLSAQN